ncbi:hypothetical protein PIB30_056390 [Stylosanthes scabra]|uniref:Uncharacterized protein n=1 Tax=Stylosanthes scabra TaxID=79078 RepID=A0ABU6VKE8_9FABA|nr:hypothetical protein [Stylosanthes scabra]
MKKAKKNNGSKNGLEKACKSGDFTKKKECEAEKRRYTDSMTTLHPKISAQNSPNAVNPDLLDRAVARPKWRGCATLFLKDEVCVEGVGTRWTWCGRAIACYALNLKEKKEFQTKLMPINRGMLPQLITTIFEALFGCSLALD